ncbi:hypothetical protein K8353_07270 [Burkholderia contaminans]|uniref:hypothetical protein n=1 Tax=Burkholderia sp. LMG 32019 TaxID=3158173 RepID=UPI003C2D0F1F|nr:hypothetical protein [Burkholderia contaminans]
MIQGFRRDKNLRKTTPHHVKKHVIRRRTMTVVRSLFGTGISCPKKSGDDEMAGKRCLVRALAGRHARHPESTL